jgi:hypothetical protein
MSLSLPLADMTVRDLMSDFGAETRDIRRQYRDQAAAADAVGPKRTSA